MNFTYPPGATPLNPDEIEGLIPKHITTQGLLNEWEQANILECELWLSSQSISIDNLLSSQFNRQLHEKMFNNTWKWAGKFRTTNKNIGVEWQQINIQLKNLLDDVRYQIQHHVYNDTELAVRFHHRLVAIHCFPNGNGRHARMIADKLMQINGNQKFTWGQKDLISANEIRKHYINALRLADRMDYSELLSFVQD